METKRTAFDGRAVWGVILVGLGFFFLLQTMGILHGLGELIVALAFMGGGALFLGAFLNTPRNWWALFPAGALGGIGLTILSSILPFTHHLGGFFFLGCLSAAFWGVYLTQRQFWAIIPGGVLATLAIITLAPGVFGGSLFFFGLAATFGLVYILTGPEGRASWALIPAAVMAVMGIIVLGLWMTRWVIPLAIVAVGLYLLLRSGNGKHE